MGFDSTVVVVQEEEDGELSRGVGAARKRTEGRANTGEKERDRDTEGIR